MSKTKRGVEQVMQTILDESGHISPSALVSAARDPNSPAHAGFEWNGSKASLEFRLVQARTWIAFCTDYEAIGAYH